MFCRHRPLRRLDFALLRRRVTMRQVLEHLHHLEQMKGPGPQLRGPCPLHPSGKKTGRTFSVNLEHNVFQCFHPHCQARGNTLDLWAAVHRLSLKEAAWNLAETFAVLAMPPILQSPTATQ